MMRSSVHRTQNQNDSQGSLSDAELMSWLGFCCSMSRSLVSRTTAPFHTADGAWNTGLNWGVSHVVTGSAGSLPTAVADGHPLEEAGVQVVRGILLHQDRTKAPPAHPSEGPLEAILLTVLIDEQPCSDMTNVALMCENI